MPFLGLFLISSCEKPNKIDYEVETGKIIKKVTCDGSSSEFWLVHFVPTRVSNSEFGISLTLDSKVYDNVVLTNFDLDAESADTSDIYLFNFNIKNDIDKDCLVSEDQSVSIPSIEIRSVVPTDAR